MARRNKVEDKYASIGNIAHETPFFNPGIVTAYLIIVQQQFTTKIKRKA
jgi:hypothetical protein